MNQCNRFINATVLYFVFHQDKVDASFCRHLFHPPLSARNVTPATLLDFSATAQNEIGFPIRVGRFIHYLDGKQSIGQ